MCAAMRYSIYFKHGKTPGLAAVLRIVLLSVAKVVRDMHATCLDKLAAVEHHLF